MLSTKQLSISLSFNKLSIIYHRSWKRMPRSLFRYSFIIKIFWLFLVILSIFILYLFFIVNIGNNQFIDVEQMFHNRLVDTLERESAKWENKVESDEINLSVLDPESRNMYRDYYEMNNIQVEINSEIDMNEDLVFITPRRNFWD